MNQEQEPIGVSDSSASSRQPSEPDHAGNSSEPPTRGTSGPKEPPSFDAWFKENNPLYLLSVLCMFAGLFIINKASHEGASLGTVVAFYGIQNLYELIMLGMGLYLLKQHVNHRHGAILLIFILVFLSDITFYQNRIVSMSSTGGVPYLGYLVSGAYWALAMLKILMAAHFLGIPLHWEKLGYSFAAFGLIYFAPQFFMESVYDLNNLARLRDEVYPQWLLYQICLVAALIQIPVIVANWRQSTLETSPENPYLGHEHRFYQYLLLFPFFLLPFQIDRNILTDVKLQGIELLPNLVPYLACSVFFLQGFIRSAIREVWSEAAYDFLIPGFLLMVTFGAYSHTSGTPSEFATTSYHVNMGLLLIGQAATALTRKNLYSMGLLGGIMAWYFLDALVQQGKHAVAYAKEVSLVAWGGLLVGLSFLLLGLGFVLSLRSRSHDTRPE